MDIHSELLQKEGKSIEISFLDHRTKIGILDKVVDFIISSKNQIAVYIENPILIQNLNLPEIVKNKLFTMDNIPKDVKHLMFFDVPPTKDDFYKILRITNASLVHLMNFGIDEISGDGIISKISGMLKYALSHLNGIVSAKRIARALTTSEETVECALMLLNDSEMIDLEKIDEDNYKISYIHPLEISRVKSNEIFNDLESHIQKINAFRNFYLNATVEDIKELVLV